MTLSPNGYDTKIICRKLTLIENKSLRRVCKKKKEPQNISRGKGAWMEVGKAGFWGEWGHL